MSRDTTIARPYAAAAFEHAREQGALDAWSDQLALLSAVVDHETIQAALDDPKLTRARRAELILAVGGERLDAGMTNLVRLLAENNRLIALPAIAEQFEHHRAEHEQTVEATVISARALTGAQEEAIIESLRKRLNKNVTLSQQVDESLIGGAVVKAGDWVMDGSMKTRLSKLSAALLR